MSKEPTPLWSGSPQLNTEDQGWDRAWKSQGQKVTRGEQESQSSGEKRGGEAGRKPSQTTPRVQMAAPGDGIWVFCLPTTWGTLHVLNDTDTHPLREVFSPCKCLGSTTAKRCRRITDLPYPPPAIRDVDPKLLKQKI